MRPKAIFLTLITSALVGGTSLIAATTPVSAQTYYPAPPPPPVAARGHELRGVVTSFYRFEMSVNSPRGENVPVQLHQGTVIAPVGASLQPGMRVVIHGYWNNGVFFANRIVVR
jgi:hypothetical protein